jgi:hypothetical protein
MPDGQAQPTPGISGQINTGKVSPTGAAQQQIQEPKYQLMAAGADLVNLGINAAYGTPEELEALRNLDNAVIGGMQQRWWQEQDKQFTANQGKEYERGTAALQASYMEELAGAADLTDPWERQAAMNAAHGRMWSELSKLDQDYMTKASKYSTNPIIGNRVGTLIQQRNDLMNKIIGGRKDVAAETETLSRAEAAQGQAEASRAQAAKAEEGAGFYTANRAREATRVPVSKAKDFIITQKGGREELQNETNQLMAEREQVLATALRQYQSDLDTGNMRLANESAERFKERFFVDPELLAGEEGESLLNVWRAEAIPQVTDAAADNIYNRLVDASRGFQPQPDNRAPAAPGGGPEVQPTPKIGAPSERPRILGPEAGEEEEERAQLATQIAETRGVPEFDVNRARQAMGGDVPETIEDKAIRMRDNMAQRYKDAGLPVPPKWSADVTDEVVAFAEASYKRLPTMEEEAKARKARPEAVQKYLRGLTDKIQRVFEMPDKGPWPKGLDRDDVIWMNLIQLHTELLDKHPDYTGSIMDMVDAALADLAYRKEKPYEYEVHEKAGIPEREGRIGGIL